MIPSLINSDTKLSDIILWEPSSVTVLNRFGIDLGVGDQTVARACDTRGIDRDFFAAILNTFLHAGYFPERILETCKASTIVDYLAQTNLYYEQYQIPNIERHFQLLIGKRTPSNGNLELMLQFFMEVKQQLLERIDHDRSQWFPSVLAIEASGPVTRGGAVDEADETDTVADKLNDLISMMVIHLHGDHDRNLALAVLLALVSLKNDLTQNDRIRNRLLRPLHRALSNR